MFLETTIPPYVMSSLSGSLVHFLRKGVSNFSACMCARFHPLVRIPDDDVIVCAVLFIILTMNEMDNDNKLVVGNTGGPYCVPIGDDNLLPFIVQCNAIMRVEYEAQKLCIEMYGRVIWCNGDDDRDRDNDHEENEFPCRWCRNKPCFVYIYEAGMVAWWTQQNWIITCGGRNKTTTCPICRVSIMATQQGQQQGHK